MKKIALKTLNVITNRVVIRGINFCLATAFLTVLSCALTFSQTLYDSFADGEFTSNPAWSGTSAWTVVTSSDVAAGATNSNTLRLNASAVTGTDYLSSQITNWGTTQEWGFFIGRRGQAFTAANQQYFWLYANEANLNSATVDGYRFAIGDDVGGDNLRIEYIVDGAVNATVITSTNTIPNGLTDIGFLVRVTRSPAGTWEIFTSALPTANGTGAIATDIPNSTNASITQGTGTNNSLIPASGGYIGVAALHSTGTNAIVAAEFDQIYFTALTPTAASVFVSGKVLGAKNRPIANARVYLTDQNGATRTALTNAFGHYRFNDVSAGETYIFNVLSKRYTFQPQVLTVTEETRNLDFTAEP